MSSRTIATPKSRRKNLLGTDVPVQLVVRQEQCLLSPLPDFSFIAITAEAWERPNKLGSAPLAIGIMMLLTPLAFGVIKCHLWLNQLWEVLLVALLVTAIVGAGGMMVKSAKCLLEAGRALPMVQGTVKDFRLQLELRNLPALMLIWLPSLKGVVAVF